MVAFSGGYKLEQHLKGMAEKLGTANTVRIGFFEHSTYPGTGTPVAMVAAIQNYGAPGAGIPPRPFFSNMVRDKSPNWGKLMSNIVVNTGYDSEKTLNVMGDAISGQLRDSIQETDSPALSPVTVMLRNMRSQNQGLVVGKRTVAEAAARVAAGDSTGGASTKPLIDTGLMMDSVGFKVNTE